MHHYILSSLPFFLAFSVSTERLIPSYGCVPIFPDSTFLRSFKDKQSNNYLWKLSHLYACFSDFRIIVIVHISITIVAL